MLFATAKSLPASAKLAELELFAHCTPRQLRRIDQLCSPAKVRAGHVLCLQGAPARQCFVVVDGRAEVTIDGRCVATIERGQLIGEIALMAPGGRRTATVTAATDMRLLVFTTGEFRSLVAAVRPFAHAILRESTRRLVDNVNSSRSPS
jgi:CRP/FNR family cyclic AMP-dependent transcriptional regulator